MTKLVTIYGGAGFVGRYVARRMARLGWRVRVVCRRPNQALFVRPYGAVGQVEVEFCNIRDDDSVRNAMRGADAVVNCVGILVPQGRNNFQAVQDEGAGRIARLAAQAGIARLVHISAIGANAASDSIYARTKAAGETAVLAAFSSATILRPSIIFGPEDRFFNRFATMAVRSPILPIFAPDTKFQPVYVDDVAAAVEYGITNDAAGIYELGGPDIVTFRQAMERMLGVINRDRRIVAFPRFVGGAIAAGADLVQTLSAGILTNRVLTRDQLRNLYTDNVCDANARSLADMGITPLAMDAVLSDYLWRFRKAGQYEAMNASAARMRKLS